MYVSLKIAPKYWEWFHKCQYQTGTVSTGSIIWFKYQVCASVCKNWKIDLNNSMLHASCWVV